jgi:thiopurine S-methyltransferase
MTQAPKLLLRDATRPDFWDERFVAGFTPWDQGGAPSDMKRCFGALVPDQYKQCLMPGCGNGYEAAYLASLGWDVVAIDFSEQAVASARLAHPDYADRIELADFFSYLPTKPLQCIYERAFLCALPPVMRPQIVTRWATLLPAGALLLGYFFIEEEGQTGSTDKISGPPFVIGSRQLTALLSPYFECIEDSPVADSIAVFENRERWQVWRRT